MYKKRVRNRFNYYSSHRLRLKLQIDTEFKQELCMTPKESRKCFGESNSPIDKPCGFRSQLIKHRLLYSSFWTRELLMRKVNYV